MRSQSNPSSHFKSGNIPGGNVQVSLSTQAKASPTDEQTRHRSTSKLENAFTYPAEIDVFVDEDDRLKVQVDTERLSLTSALEDPKHLAPLSALYGSEDVMRFYASGQTKSPPEVETLLHRWSQRWKEQDPFSGFSVHLRDGDDFVGTTVLGRSGTPGQAEFAFALMPEFWSKHYGSECGSAIVHGYADYLVSRDTLLDNVRFSGISATARTDNPKSYRCLEKLGFKNTSTEEKYGALRHHYLLKL